MPARPSSRRRSSRSPAAERTVGRRPEDVPADAPALAGAFAFKLHDTYGFPIDLTIELAAEYGVRVDREGFEVALAEQRERSRGGRKAELARHAELTALYESIGRRSGDTTFVGYETTSVEATVVAILRDGVAFDELTGHGEAEVVLDRTPFYAEGGGQVGDRGELTEPGGGSPLFTVTDTQRPSGGMVVHRGTLHGRLRVGATVAAAVDAERRARTMRNHTATHLLHRALRNVAGPSARQAGSLVAPDYLRFDYPFDRALTDEEKLRIEDEVRRVVREDRPVGIAYMSMAEAIAAGADAFFDEKYGETVRTIRVRDYSFELCGGTHCRASGEIGGFVITGDRSIGSGMRRIEALTGDGADAHLRERAQLLDAVVDRLGAQSAGGGPRPDRRARGRAPRGEAPTPRGRRRGAQGRRPVAAGRGASPRASGSSRRRALGVDRCPQGRRQGGAGPARPGRDRAGPRRRRAAGLRDRVRRPGRPRHLRRRPRPGRDAGARRQGRRPARDGPGEGQPARRAAGRPGRRADDARRRGPERVGQGSRHGLPAPVLAARRRRPARRLHGARHRDGVRKALVFEIDERSHGTVRGVGRKRQGLAHMQSGTVADIGAVVDNCAVALQEAEEMAGFRPTQVVIGIAGELVKGFTTAHTQERKRPDTPITDRSSRG